jgi:hypothetical protein
MTPKEKAKELTDKYFYFGDQEFDYSKEFALITVDEILKLNHPIVIVYTETSDNLIEQYTQEYYWEQVKHEIEKL